MQQKKTSQAQLLVKFIDEYRSTEMIDSLASLRRWRDDNAVIFANYQFLAGTQQHDEINKARQFVKAYFFRALTLYENKFVNDAFMKVICENRGIEILLNIVEPLEYSLSDFIDRVKKSEVQADTYQYVKNLEPDFKIKFDRLRELKKKFN